MHTQTCYDGYLFFHPDLRRIVELLTVLQEITEKVQFRHLSPENLPVMSTIPNPNVTYI